MLFWGPFLARAKVSEVKVEENVARPVKIEGAACVYVPTVYFANNNAIKTRERFKIST